MDIMNVATNLSDFIHFDSQLTNQITQNADMELTKRTAQNAVERMRDSRTVGRLGELGHLGNLLSFEIKRPLTAAERTRAYRLRKRLLSGAEINPGRGRPPKLRPFTAAERTRRYRERKKKAAQVLNGETLSEEWVNQANGWEGVVLLSDNIAAPKAQKKCQALFTIKDDDTITVQPTSLENGSVSERNPYTKTIPVLPMKVNIPLTSKQDTSVTCVIGESKNKYKSNFVEERKFDTSSITAKSEDQSSLTVEPITTILLEGDLSPRIESEFLNPCDVEGSEAFEPCITDKWIDETDSGNSNPLADVDCEPSIVSTEKCIAFDSDVLPVADVPIRISIPTANRRIFKETRKRPAIIGDTRKNVISCKTIDQIKNIEFGDCDYATSSTCDSCRRVFAASDVSRLSRKQIRLLQSKFFSKNVEERSICQMCKNELLNKNQTSGVSQVNENEDPLSLFFGNSLWQTE